MKSTVGYIEKPVNQKEMLSFLGISRTTIIKLRQEKKIPYLSIGNKILYQPTDVVRALSMNS